MLVKSDIIPGNQSNSERAGANLVPDDAGERFTPGAGWGPKSYPGGRPAVLAKELREVNVPYPVAAWLQALPIPEHGLMLKGDRAIEHGYLVADLDHVSPDMILLRRSSESVTCWYGIRNRAWRRSAKPCCHDNCSIEMQISLEE